MHEHVHHEVDVVHEDPLGRAATLDVVRTKPEIAAQSLFDALRDGEDLAVRSTVTDDEVVGDVALAAQVEDDELVGLLVQRGFSAVQ